MNIHDEDWFAQFHWDISGAYYGDHDHANAIDFEKLKQLDKEKQKEYLKEI